MLKYILRLDDACENMNEEKWKRIERLLDKYHIKPIVGIIPKNKDKEFTYSNIVDFWRKYVRRWKDKGWIVAQHGFNHNLSKENRTEFSGKSLKEQKNILIKGYNVMKENDIFPECFFAPAHTFDDNTIKAIDEINKYKFISDGYALFPYNEKNVMFIPCVFDTPHKIFPIGIFTFVYHPNNMEEHDFLYLEKFLKKNYKNFEINIDFILKKFKNRKRNIFDVFIEKMINLYRKMRKDVQR